MLLLNLVKWLMELTLSGALTFWFKKKRKKVGAEWTEPDREQRLFVSWLQATEPRQHAGHERFSYQMFLRN